LALLDDGAQQIDVQAPFLVIRDESRNGNDADEHPKGDPNQVRSIAHMIHRDLLKRQVIPACKMQITAHLDAALAGNF
jgi:hypothetical protein